jgi:hypothetical protein
MEGKRGVAHRLLYPMVSAANGFRYVSYLLIMRANSAGWAVNGAKSDREEVIHLIHQS